MHFLLQAWHLIIETVKHTSLCLHKDKSIKVHIYAYLHPLV